MAVVVSGASPLADGFRSRFFTGQDYHRFHAQTPRYDAENAFFAEDFAEHVMARYLKAPLPERFGGSGLSGTGDGTGLLGDLAAGKIA